MLLATLCGVAGAQQPISTLQSKSSALAAKIATIQVKLQVLGEEYDQAATREALLKRDIHKDLGAIATARATAGTDRQSLEREVIDAYVNDGASSSALSVLTGKENAYPAQQTYLEAAAGKLSTAVALLRVSEHALIARTAQLRRDSAQSHLALKTLGAARAHANKLDSQLTATLAGINGSLAAAVAREEQQQAIRAAAQAAAKKTIEEAQQHSDASASTDPSAATATPSGDGPGLVAVKAAESQIGVPYVWGGASPGYGFDCSGLAMWAWGQAGVSLPHSAEDQYLSIEHVPFSDLQPGDLIFYAYGGYVYHVVIYIGDGNVVQAEQTGTLIEITPMPPGADAAGRP
jgi:cell wall-associated NlpC family hydrolase